MFHIGSSLLTILFFIKEKEELVQLFNLLFPLRGCLFIETSIHRHLNSSGVFKQLRIPAKWWAQMESNHRPRRYQHRALTD